MIHLIYGPPCAGKTTLVLASAKPGDLVVDHDLLAQRAGSGQTHDHQSEYRDAAEAQVLRLLDEVADGLHAEAWVIRTAPDSQRRDELASYINAGDVRLVSAPRDVLIARAQHRPNPVSTVRAINRWFETADKASPRRHRSW